MCESGANYQILFPREKFLFFYQQRVRCTEEVIDFVFMSCSYISVFEKNSEVDKQPHSYKNKLRLTIESHSERRARVSRYFHFYVRTGANAWRKTNISRACPPSWGQRGCKSCKDVGN